MSEAAIAATPASSSCSRWSTDAAPSRTPELRGAGARELLGVEPHAEARRGRRTTDPLGGGEVEEAGIGEDVDELRQALRGHGRDHLVRDERGVAGRRGARGDGVRAEEGRHDPHRQPIGHAANDAEVAQLLVERQPVAGLALDGGRAGGERGAQPRLAQRLERGVVGVTRRGDGAQDPAARCTARPRGVAAASSDRSPAKTGWVWLSTRPGVTSAPPRSRRSSVGGASTGEPIHAMRPSRTWIAHGEIPAGARRPVPVRSFEPGAVMLAA